MTQIKNYINKIGIYLVVYNSLIVAGCVDRIPVNIKGEQTLNLVFDGRLIYGDPTYVYLSVAHLLDFAQSRTLLIAVDQVILRNSLGQSKSLAYIKYGYYEAVIHPQDPDFTIIPGLDFQIVLSLADGRRYESRAEKLLPSNKQGYLNYEIVNREIKDRVTGLFQYDHRLQFNLHTSFVDPINLTRKQKYKYEYNFTFKFTDNEEKVCYIRGELELNKINHLSGRDFSEDTVNYPLYQSAFSYRFYEGAYFTVYQQTLSDAAYAYWQKADQLISRDGSMFEEPPGRIKGNFYRSDHPEEVFGYFYATTQDTFRLYMPSEVISSPYQNYCEFINSRGISFFLCANCLDGTNSSLEKPVWWVE